MKQTLIGIIVGLLIGGAVVWTYEQRQHPAEKEKPKEQHKEASIVQHGTNGDTFLKLTKEVREHMGLKTEPLERAELSPEIKAYGKVQDPTPLATLLIDQTTAKASLDASSKEYERVKQLFAAGQNASARAVEAAEAMMKKDRIQLDAIQSRLALAMGPEAASKLELPKLVESLLQLKAALVRMDVPLTEKLTGHPAGARIASAASQETFTDATYLGASASADPQFQGQGFLFLVQTNPPPPGSSVIGWLKLPGEPDTGVVVPREAIVRHEGEAFIYVQEGEDIFVRKELELEHPLGNGWFIEKGLKAKQSIVVQGAQQLLSEEFKGEGGGD
ncbi:MAG: hypothetical protein JWM16_1508 [Verrucomicrobiales bacterium]|nr:hypothetical protein [Verrucomicrobiales bacterium]